MRKIDTNVAGVSCSANNSLLRVDLDKTATVLSSAVYNGGLTTTKTIINFHVPNNFNRAPDRFIKARLSELNLSPDAVCLMTAAHMDSAHVKTIHFGRSAVSVICTAGLSNPQCAGDPVTGYGNKTAGARSRIHGAHSTINLIIVLKGNATDSCLANIITTASEAKASAMRDLDVRSKSSSRLATGTSTDSTAVISIPGREKFDYSGTATELGYHLASAVRESITDSVAKQDGLIRSRSLVKRLEEHGILLEDLVTAAIKLVVNNSNRVYRTKLRSNVKEAIIEASLDPNVSSLVIAALELEDQGEIGLIPTLSETDYAKDPIYLVADEDIGEMIARYISGTRGIHNFRIYDRHKPGIIGKLGPFLDDAMCGLIGGAMSKMYTQMGERTNSRCQKWIV